MNPQEASRRAQDLFDVLLGLPPEERLPFLQAACAGDDALCREVEALLRAHDEARTDLLFPPLFTEGPAPSLLGQQVGPYRLLREIGAGGMGMVYLAERVDGQFRKRVALKLIKRGMDTEDILRRFLHERQILAGLEHPGIARLLDGGVTGDGRPYFVMEHVEGLPITDYCDRNRLSMEERLKLFERVCAAVHYAHQNLVVHRDIKPSNLLVTADGEVKLLDFGIAKLLNPELGAQSVPVTRTGLLLMTPEYAAPEQVRGETVTTATDVYALGVLLYELLTGHRPFRLKSRLQQEVERVICEEEPEKPSTVVTREEVVDTREGTMRLTPEHISRARQTRPEALRRHLSGDLDNIVLMAMRKEPRRRYGSATQLAGDIRHFLEGLPVAAQKDTFRYRAAKFLGRHRLGAAIAASFVVLILGFGLLYTIQITRERNRARLEAEKAAQVSEFLVDLFKTSDPQLALGETITARAVMDQGAQRIQEELRDQPALQAMLMQVIGQVYTNLGLFDEADPLLSQALAQRQRVLGREHPDVAQNLQALGELLRLRGDYEPAEALFREALAINRRRLGAEHEEVATNLHNLATVLLNKGDYESAEVLLREALAMKQKLLGEDPSVASTMNTLGTLFFHRGDYDAAEALLRETLSMQRQLLGASHPDVTATLNNLAATLGKKGERDEAEQLYREALASNRKLFGEAHPYVAENLINIAMSRLDQGDPDAAEALLREALAMQQHLLGEAHPMIAQTLNSLAGVLLQKGDLDTAEPLFLEALAMQQKLLGREHPETAQTLHNLAHIAFVRNDDGAAERFLRDVLAIRRTVLGNTHPDVASTLNGLGVVLERRGNCREAEPFLRESLQVREQTLPEGHWMTANSRVSLGNCLITLQRYAEAESLLVAGYTTLQAQRGARDGLTVNALTRLIALYEAWGKPEKTRHYRVLLPEPADAD